MEDSVFCSKEMDNGAEMHIYDCTHHHHPSQIPSHTSNLKEASFFSHRLDSPKFIGMEFDVFPRLY